MQRFFYRNQLVFQALAIYEAFLVGLSLLICLLRGKLTVTCFGSTLALLGGLLVSFGMLSLFGTWSSTRSFDYQYGMSIGHDAKQREAHTQEQIRDALGFFTNSLIVGWLSGAVGLALTIL